LERSPKVAKVQDDNRLIYDALNHNKRRAWAAWCVLYVSQFGDVKTNQRWAQ